MLERILKFFKVKDEDINRRETRVYEIIPGLLIWITLFVCIFVLSIFKPIWGIFFIIFLDIYWVIRIWYMFAYLLSSWIRYIKAGKIDWGEKLHGINGWENYIHLVAMPTYKEPYDVIKQTFDKLLEVNYQKDKMIIVLGGEERDEVNFLKIVENVRRDYGDKFQDIVFTTHPKNLEGEIPGKGSNMYHIGREMTKYFEARNIDISRVIISMFDIETWTHKEYFNCLAYHYLTIENPERHSYQPLVLFNNNVWQSNPIVRVVAHSTTFWLLTDLSRAERLFTFSSHSMSFKTLVEVGYHPKDVVTEDTRIFLHCLNHFNGDYRVCPIFIPVSMQTVDVGNFFESLKNQYIQIRRWGWGVEHFPWMMMNLVKNKKIAWKIKIKYLWNQSEGVYTWATLPILVTIMGYLPIKMADLSIHYNVLIHNTPYLLERIMGFGMIGLFTASAMNLFFLPKKPKNIKTINYLIIVVQWVLFPITMILFGSIPSLEAQTRLMLGGKHRLGFQVTKKT